MDYDIPKVNEFCWNELATVNVQEAKDFYGNVFGWEFEEHNMGGMTYTMAKLNGKDLAGIWAIPKEHAAHVPPHWMSYILVDDVEKSLEKAKSAGATVVKEVTSAGEVGKFAIIIDPVGAHIAMWQPVRN